MDGGGLIKGKVSNRIKIYLVVGLVLVLAALLYRHLKAKQSPNMNVSPPTASALLAEVPEIPAFNTGSVAMTEPAKSKTKEPRRTSIRDIFAPMRPWKNTGRRVTGKGQRLAQKAPPLKLKGVIVGGRNPVAIINGKLLRKGERIEGYEVIRIEEKEVFLKSGNRTVKLKLANNE